MTLDILALAIAQQPAGQTPPETAATTAAVPAPQAFLDGEGLFLWSGFGGFVLVAVLTFILLLRSRVKTPGHGRAAQPARSRKSKKQTDFFEPAGADAEITFENEVAATPTAEPEEAEVLFDDPPAEPEALEVVEEAPAPAPKKGAFAGLFAKKPARVAAAPGPAESSEDDIADAPADETDLSTDEFDEERLAFAEREREDERQRVLAEAEEARLLTSRLADQARAEEAEEDRRRALEESRLAAEREAADAARRRAEEEARLAAERDAEFERRKEAAAHEQRERDSQRRAEALAALSGNGEDLRREVADEFERRFQALSERLEARVDTAAAKAPAPDSAGVDALARDIEKRLTEMNARLESRLASAPKGDAGGAAIADIVTRRIAEHRDAINASIAALGARIDAVAGAPDEASALRRDINALKRAIGERVSGPFAPQVQLADLVRNALPPDAYALGAALSSGRKVDCLVRLPFPPGPIAIDARFPVEAFNSLAAAGDGERAGAESEFRRAALRHIVDVAERLIAPEETAESALLFLPSEGMYATLHERFADIVQDSYRARVWIVSPTTLMATLHTVRAVMRDARTRESAETIHAEATHVLAEVDALRRRVVKLEDDFSKAQHDVRDVLSSTDQVYRRAETISNTRKSLADEGLDRGSKRIISAEGSSSAPEAQPSDKTGEGEDKSTFPLR